MTEEKKEIIEESKTIEEKGLSTDDFEELKAFRHEKELSKAVEGIPQAENRDIVKQMLQEKKVTGLEIKATVVEIKNKYPSLFASANEKLDTRVEISSREETFKAEKSMEAFHRAKLSHEDKKEIEAYDNHEIDFLTRDLGKLRANVMRFEKAFALKNSIKSGKRFY